MKRRFADVVPHDKTYNSERLSCRGWTWRQVLVNRCSHREVLIAVVRGR